jgi:hypothetical protein
MIRIFAVFSVLLASTATASAFTILIYCNEYPHAPVEMHEVDSDYVDDDEIYSWYEDCE